MISPRLYMYMRSNPTISWRNRITRCRFRQLDKCATCPYEALLASWLYIPFVYLVRNGSDKLLNCCCCCFRRRGQNKEVTKRARAKIISLIIMTMTLLYAPRVPRIGTICPFKYSVAFRILSGILTPRQSTNNTIERSSTGTTRSVIYTPIEQCFNEASI
jgi:hypothetical protein